LPLDAVFPAPAFWPAVSVVPLVADDPVDDPVWSAVEPAVELLGVELLGVELLGVAELPLVPV